MSNLTALSANAKATLRRACDRILEPLTIDLDVTEEGVDCSVSDLQFDAQIIALELDILDLQQGMDDLRDTIQVTEIGLADLKEIDYPAYCAVYEQMYGCQPNILRQAE